MGHTYKMKKLAPAFLAVLLIASGVFTVKRLLGSDKLDLTDDRATILSDADLSSLPEEPVSSEEEPISEQDKAAVDYLADRIVLYRGSYGARADKKVEELLNEMSGINAGYGVLWKNIMDYWDYINADFAVNEKAVPEGLSKRDNLCIIVLGHKLAPDGTIRYELNGRLEKALECAGKYPNAWVMCTGGGTASYNKQATEAGQMCQWFAEKGIDSRRLIKEDQSKSTVENALNCYEILTRDYPQVDSVLLVSSRYHLKWATLLFEASFMKSAKEKNKPMIHVVSNYAFPINSTFYKSKYDLRWQTAGMFELLGDTDHMHDFTYDDSYERFMARKRPKM